MLIIIFSKWNAKNEIRKIPTAMYEKIFSKNILKKKEVLNFFKFK